MQEDTPEVTEIPQQCRVWNARSLGWTYERIQAEFGLTPRDVSLLSGIIGFRAEVQ